MDRDALRALAIARGAEIRFGEPMARHTSLGIGGEADFLLRPRGWSNVMDLLEALWESNIPFRVAGGGTNLFVEDGPLGFGVLTLGRCAGGIRWEGESAEVDADIPLPALCAQAARRGLSGLEGMEGIPGTVGGGLVMNAGAFKCEMGNVVREVTLAAKGSGRIVRPAGEFQWGYRRSGVRDAGIALACRLTLDPSNSEQIRLRMEEAREHRRSTQPWREATAGSVFKNPPGDHAGRILESLGFKGRRRGRAGFSSIHANFLVNYGRATFSDAWSLCEEAREAAFKIGLALEYEVEVWRRASATEVRP